MDDLHVKYQVLVQGIVFKLLNAKIAVQWSTEQGGSVACFIHAAKKQQKNINFYTKKRRPN